MNDVISDAQPRVVEELRLRGRSLAALMRNDTLAIRIPGFLSPSETRAVEEAIHEVGLDYYVGDTKAASQQRKGKIGPNLFRFKDDLPAYFERARHFEAQDMPRLFRRVDVLDRFEQTLETALGPRTVVERARSAVGVLSGCTVRDLPSAPPHVDWICAEMPQFEAFSDLIDQFAWNVYISVGQTGGETAIYDTGVPDHARRPALVLPPQRGDLLLFRTRNVHAVLPSEGARLTVSGFWGPTLQGHLKYWV